MNSVSLTLAETRSNVGDSACFAWVPQQRLIGASAMALKVGINGFGRIGRLVFRAGIKNPNIEFVGINDLVQPDYLAYLLKHDSTHGLFKGTVEAKDKGIVVDGKFVTCVSVRRPEELPWGATPAQYG